MATTGRRAGCLERGVFLDEAEYVGDIGHEAAAGLEEAGEGMMELEDGGGCLP